MNHPLSIHKKGHDWHRQLEGGKRSVYVTRELIVKPGNADNRVFVVEQGKARICLFGDAREQTLGYLTPGSVYVTHSPAWVEALEATTIISWPIEQIRDLLDSDTQVVLCAIREVGNLLNNAIGIIENLAFRSVESRLAHYLLTESVQQSSPTINLIGNTEILASLLGTTRQTTSTILNKMEKEQLISRPERNRITLLNPEALTQLAATLSAS